MVSNKEVILEKDRKKTVLLHEEQRARKGSRFLGFVTEEDNAKLISSHPVIPVLQPWTS